MRVHCTWSTRRSGLRGGPTVRRPALTAPSLTRPEPDRSHGGPSGRHIYTNTAGVASRSDQSDTAVSSRQTTGPRQSAAGRHAQKPGPVTGGYLQLGWGSNGAKIKPWRGQNVVCPWFAPPFQFKTEIPTSY